MKYLIWCTERNMWWKSSERGYTTDIALAGRYYSDEAKRILTEANKHRREEFMVLSPEESENYE